ncbi:uncharacterized protein LOC131006271 [Salvia miltiorrhiza]|uniref:uncharacterized protein LOC131006271 n=1 Tax=Salvia miltiorrhiza TaxID=226208 RepID=UPI0025AD830E|nr:uncharacterized protein LOC131006271 [Salvia miltiorrhiza]
MDDNRDDELDKTVSTAALLALAFIGLFLMFKIVVTGLLVMVVFLASLICHIFWFVSFHCILILQERRWRHIVKRFTLWKIVSLALNTSATIASVVAAFHGWRFRPDWAALFYVFYALLIILLVVGKFCADAVPPPSNTIACCKQVLCRCHPATVVFIFFKLQSKRPL